MAVNIYKNFAILRFHPGSLSLSQLHPELQLSLGLEPDPESQLHCLHLQSVEREESPIVVAC